MGFFSDRCEALVDENGIALTGEALKQAKETPRAIRCGNHIPKRARCCSKCGSSSPKGWWKCPSCGKWVGNDSKFCSHCRSPLFPDERDIMNGGIWRKDPDTFAQRIEVGDVKGILNNDLIIQQGTAALIMEDGLLKKIVEAGKYSPKTLKDKIPFFGTGNVKRSVIMIDAAEIIIPINLEGMRSKELFELEFFGEVILKFHYTDDTAVKFIENMLKQQRHITYGDLTDYLSNEIKLAIRAACSEHSIDELVVNHNIRIQLQNEMFTVLQTALDSCGLDLIRVSTAEFGGDEYEDYIEEHAELDKKRREVEYQIRMQEMHEKSKMNEFKSENDLLEFERSLAHELEVSDMHREREKQELLNDWRRQDEADEMMHQVDLKKMDDEYQRDRNIKDNEADVIILNQNLSQEDNEVKKALEWRAAKNQQNLDLKDAHKSRRRDMSLEEMILDEDDPEKRRDLIKLLQMKQEKEMTPEQVLAAAAKNNPAAAQALAAMKNNSEEKYNLLLAEMKDLYADNQDRQDKHNKDALNTVAKSVGNNNTIVK